MTKQNTAAAVRRQNKQKLMAIAADYVSGSDADRRRIIDNINGLISEADFANNPNVKIYIEGYRDALLSYSDVPAAN